MHSFGDEETTVMPLEAYMDSTMHKEIPEQLVSSLEQKVMKH